MVPAVEAANDRLRPLSCNSVLAVVTTVLKCVKRDAPNFQTKVSNSISGATRAIMAAEAVVSAIKEDPLAADLVLAFFGMAVSSYRWGVCCMAFVCSLLWLLQTCAVRGELWDEVDRVHPPVVS